MRGFPLSLFAVLVFAGCQDCGGDGFASLVPLVTPSQDTLALGAVYVGAADSEELVVRSSGTAVLTIDGARLEGDAMFSLSGSPAGGLSPGGERRLTVTFTPVSAGAFTATLIVDSDADNDPELRVAVTGTALAPLPCDDDNECTDEAFNATRGECVATFRSGGCDDGSSCTTDDRCSGGSCIGTAVDCQAANACELGVCAADEGCLSVPDPDVCDDDNPCSLDSCDAVTGCSHEAASDGTPCAPLTGCSEAHVCLSGACVAVEVPDGVPCFDGDLCTVGDSCQDGVCVGDRVARDPEVVGTLRTFGGWFSRVTLLDDGKLLFVDGFFARPVVTLVDTSSGALEARSRLDVELGTSAPAPLPAGRALLFQRGLSGEGMFAAVVGQDASGELVQEGSVQIAPENHDVDYAATLGSVVYGCGFGDGVYVVDATDPGAPVPGTHLDFPAGGGYCRGLVVDAANNRAWLPLSTGGLWQLDLTAPASPVDAGVSLENTVNAPVAISGDMAAIYRRLPSANAGGDLQLVDSSTLASLGAIPVPELESVHWLAFSDDELLLARSQARSEVLERWNVSDPAAPTLVDEALVWSNMTDWQALRGAADGATVVLAGTDMSAAVFRRPAEGPLVRQRGPELGRMGAVARRDGDLVVYAPDAVRSVTMADPAAPVVVAASVLPYRSGLVSFSAARKPPTFAALDFIPANSTWLDASAVGAATAAGTLNLAPSNGGHIARSTGTTLYSIDSDSDSNAFLFQAFDLTEVPAGFQVTLQPTGTTMGTFDGLSSNVRIAPDVVGGRVAASSSSPFTNQAAVAVIDVEDPGAPALLATASLDTSIRGMALSGDLLVIIRDPTGNGQPPHLSLWSLSSGALLQSSSVPMTNGSVSRVLAFDGRTALVQATGAVVFVDVQGSEPTVLGTLETADTVLEVTFAQDHLVLTSSTSLQTASPPCPPPPP